MGKGPKFIPKAKSLSTSQRQQKSLKPEPKLPNLTTGWFGPSSVLSASMITRRDAIRRDAGIQSWTPKQRSLTTEYCRTYVQRFFKCADENGAWRGNQFLSPSFKFFDRRIHTMERDIVVAATNAKKTLTTSMAEIAAEYLKSRSICYHSV